MAWPKMCLFLSREAPPSDRSLSNCTEASHLEQLRKEGKGRRRGQAARSKVLRVMECWAGACRAHVRSCL